MNRPTFDDRLELFGLLAGVFVILAGLGMLTAQPWSTAEGSAAALVRLLGIVVAVAIGIVVIIVTRNEDIEELLPTS